MTRWLPRTLKNHGSPSGALALESTGTRQPVSLLALLQLKNFRLKAEFPLVEFIPSASSVSKVSSVSSVSSASSVSSVSSVSKFSNA
jgi:hypothetical protein